MLRLVLSFVVVFFLPVIVCDAQDPSDAPAVPQEDKQPSVLFTHGPGGPIRDDKMFYAGEAVCILVEIPKKLIPEAVSDLFCEMSLISKENRTQRLSSPQPIPFQGFAPGEKSAFFPIFMAIPRAFDEGDCEIALTVSNRQGETVVEGKEKIELRPASQFGIRHPFFYHGLHGNPPQWGPGSNIYKVGEVVRIGLGIGGLSLNDQGEFEASIKITFFDGEGAAFDSASLGQPLPILKMQAPRGAPYPLATFHQNFGISQPGSYRMKIDVKDLVSGKEDSMELPLRILDPFE